MSLQQSYIFTGLCIPYSAYAIKTGTEYKISLRIELHPCDFSLMALQNIGATGSVHIIHPYNRVGRTSH